MRRYTNLYARLCSYEHLYAAALHAYKGKARQRSAADFFSNLSDNLLALQQELTTHTYRTSPYTLFVLREPKERLIYRLPFRDRVVQWAIMLLLEPIWVRTFTRDTYSCITGRGIHGAFRRLKEDLKDVEGTQYCLKVDIRKFYPTVNHDILKCILREKLKDSELLALLDSIIDSVPAGDGVPIGNFLSQYFANLYLSELDHLLKERYGVRYYYRYADDMVILSGSKAFLHGLLITISDYLHGERRMALKGNYQVFPVASRGIDFVGYVFFHTHILARKKNKQGLARALSKLRKRGLPEKQVMLKVASRVGFIKHSDSSHLFKSLNVVSMKKFSEVQKEHGKLLGSKLHINEILNRPMHLLAYEIGQSKHNNGQCLTLQYEVEEAAEWVKHITFTGSNALIHQLDGITPKDMPISTMIVKQTLGSDDKKMFYKFVDPDNPN